MVQWNKTCEEHTKLYEPEVGMENLTDKTDKSFITAIHFSQAKTFESFMLNRAQDVDLVCEFPHFDRQIYIQFFIKSSKQM